jgi:hypothetical protein
MSDKEQYDGEKEQYDGEKEQYDGDVEGHGFTPKVPDKAADTPDTDEPDVEGHGFTPQADL